MDGLSAVSRDHVPDCAACARRGDPRRSPVLDHATLPLAKPARRKTALCTGVREPARVAWPMVDRRDGAFSDLELLSEPAVIAARHDSHRESAGSRAGSHHARDSFLHLLDSAYDRALVDDDLHHLWPGGNTGERFLALVGWMDSCHADRGRTGCDSSR